MSVEVKNTDTAVFAPPPPREVAAVVVYRVEHVDCPAAGHGPALMPDGCSYYRGGLFRRPAYGTTGPTPQGEGLHIYPHHVCGVTEDQFDQWWSHSVWDAPDHDEAMPHEMPDGWAVVAYELPLGTYEKGFWQVVFEKAHAIRRYEVKDEFYLDHCIRRLPPVGGSLYGEAYISESDDADEQLWE